jgi:predicted ATP-grasp superfamily ATP-dependent carboligase
VKTICEALTHIEEAKQMVEAGVDLVIDEHEEVWLIEINSRPRGRLEVLASHDPSAYLDDHINACARPIRVIAQWG